MGVGERVIGVAMMPDWKFTIPTSMSCPPAVWWQCTAISTVAPGVSCASAAALMSKNWYCVA
jgi:hypothetical protein